MFLLKLKNRVGIVFRSTAKTRRESGSDNAETGWTPPGTGLNTPPVLKKANLVLLYPAWHLLKKFAATHHVHKNGAVIFMPVNFLC
jgi:hypothetical protein